jgi:hypothetical protein
MPDRHLASVFAIFGMHVALSAADWVSRAARNSPLTVHLASRAEEKVAKGLIALLEPVMTECEKRVGAIEGSQEKLAKTMESFSAGTPSARPLVSRLVCTNKAMESDRMRHAGDNRPLMI